MINQAGITAVIRLERKQGSGRVAPATLAGVRKALEEAGAEFLPDGVRPPSCRTTGRTRPLQGFTRDQPARRRPPAGPCAVDGCRSVRRERPAGMIVIDSSALIAILRREPEADNFLQIIAEAGRRLPTLFG